MKTITIATLGIASLGLAATVGAAPAPHAKLTMAEARAIALKHAPGKIADAEYDKD